MSRAILSSVLINLAAVRCWGGYPESDGKEKDDAPIERNPSSDIMFISALVVNVLDIKTVPRKGRNNFWVPSPIVGRGQKTKKKKNTGAQMAPFSKSWLGEKRKKKEEKQKIKTLGKRGEKRERIPPLFGGFFSRWWGVISLPWPWYGSSSWPSPGQGIENGGRIIISRSFFFWLFSHSFCFNSFPFSWPLLYKKKKSSSAFTDGKLWFGRALWVPVPSPSDRMSQERRANGPRPSFRFYNKMKGYSLSNAGCWQWERYCWPGSRGDLLMSWQV